MRFRDFNLSSSLDIAIELLELLAAASPIPFVSIPLKILKEVIERKACICTQDKELTRLLHRGLALHDLFGRTLQAGKLDPMLILGRQLLQEVEEDINTILQTLCTSKWRRLTKARKVEETLNKLRLYMDHITHCVLLGGTSINVIYMGNPPLVLDPHGTTP